MSSPCYCSLGWCIKFVYIVYILPKHLNSAGSFFSDSVLVRFSREDLDLVAEREGRGVVRIHTTQVDLKGEEGGGGEWTIWGPG